MWIAAACLAALATCATYFEQRYPVPPPWSWLARLLDYVQLPAFLLSAVISGNVHRPLLLLWFVLVFATYLGLFVICVALSRSLRNVGAPDA